VTPTNGSPAITIVEVGPVNSSTPEFYHVSSIVRFKVTNMTLSSTNVPR
jgi:hypothetical protein